MMMLEKLVLVAVMVLAFSAAAIFFRIDMQIGFKRKFAQYEVGFIFMIYAQLPIFMILQLNMDGCATYKEDIIHTSTYESILFVCIFLFIVSKRTKCLLKTHTYSMGLSHYL